jgi:pimeloyl-ACP methyl ester carboxylesterase
MIPIILVTMVALLVLATQTGALIVARTYPPLGKTVAVKGAALNVVELGPQDAEGPAILLLHGASCNLDAMRRPLGELLAKKHRVILIDRPGHGWSTRERAADSTPQVHAAMIAEALDKLRLGSVIVVAHSLAGALGARLALDHADRVEGLVLLAPVTHPWYGGVGWYNKAISMPVIGPLLAYTITLPLGLLLAEKSARHVFLPQAMPDGYVKDTATPLLLRPREFIANARDLVTLKQAVEEQAPRYGEIRAPVTIISGDHDRTVSTVIHSRLFARAVPNAKLIVLEGIGHMIQNAVPDLVASEIEAMMGELPRGTVRLDKETRAAAEEGLAEAKRGEFARDDEVAKADARRGL